MFVTPKCDLRDVALDRRNIVQSMIMFTYNRLFHRLTPLPDFSHFGDTIPRGVTAAIGIAFFANKVACYVTDNAGQQSPRCTVNTVLTVVQQCVSPQYTTCWLVVRMLKTTEKYGQSLK